MKNNFQLINGVKFNKEAKNAFLELLKGSKLLDKTEYSYQFAVSSKYENILDNLMNLVLSSDSLLYNIIEIIKNQSNGEKIIKISRNEFFEAMQIRIYKGYEDFLNNFVELDKIKNKEEWDKILKKNLIYDEKGKYDPNSKAIINLIKTRLAFEKLDVIAYIGNVFVPYIKNNKAKVSEVKFDRKEYKDLYKFNSLKAKEIQEILKKLDKKILTLKDLYKEKYPELNTSYTEQIENNII